MEWPNMPILKMNPLIDCDGKPRSQENLEALLKMAIDVENYELAKVYNDEIKRLRSINIIDKMQH